MIDTIRFSGGIINRFYSNRNMIQLDFREENYFKNKDINETISEEDVELNGDKTEFEFSVMKPGFKDDGIITFNDYNSLLRIKYDVMKNYKSIITDLISLVEFFEFSANSLCILFDEVFLELKNEKGKYEKVVEIIIPCMTNNEINKDMFDYNIFKGHLNNIFKFLNNCNYIFSIIPDDKSFESISNKDYCACISCFESIYQFVHGNNDIISKTQEEVALEKVKAEILPLLQEVENKYKGNSKTNRAFIKRFINIISTANLKLEKCIFNELEKNKFIIEIINSKKSNKIENNGILDSIIKAVKDRDDITHNTIVKLDNTSIEIYEMILLLNYVMIFEFSGILKEIYEEKIKHLSDINII